MNQDDMESQITLLYGITDGLVKTTSEQNNANARLLVEIKQEIENLKSATASAKNMSQVLQNNAQRAALDTLKKTGKSEIKQK
jgi:hypothetical protein